MQSINFNEIELTGQTGKLLNNIIYRWLIGIDESNPAIIDMFKARDIKPFREMLPWSGEFAGKYLTGAYYVYKLTHNKDLFNYVEGFIERLLECQDDDGYLGCFQRLCRLTGAYSHDPSDIGCTWDSWNHYHVMYGLLKWYELTGNDKYFNAIDRIADLFIRSFYSGGRRLVDIGSSEMNLAVYHVFGILYRRTKNVKYLNFAKEIETDISSDQAGDYINVALSGKEFYECPKPRWESMHVIMGIAEAYKNTGDEKYKRAASNIFYSILKTDVHNTGGFSTDEQAIGHPYKNAAIETCCVIAYNALAIEIYELTGDPAIIDFLERSHYNAVLGYYSTSGKWSTYNTPMDGVKCANYHSIGFQCRPGSPDLNCCSVNAPRGVANLCEWLVAEENSRLYINFYGDLRLVTDNGVKIEITGKYPANDSVLIKINSDSPIRIALRIPGWSCKACITVNGRSFTAEGGKYFETDDFVGGEIVVKFDFSARFEPGDMDYKGAVSIFKGPVLFGFDQSDNPFFDLNDRPELIRAEVEKAKTVLRDDGSIVLATSNAVLKDFYHLGQTGGQYKTWLTVK